VLYQSARKHIPIKGSILFSITLKAPYENLFIVTVGIVSVSLVKLFNKGFSIFIKSSTDIFIEWVVNPG